MSLPFPLAMLALWMLAPVDVSSQTNITIAAVLSSAEHENIFRDAVHNLTAPSGYRYVSKTLLSSNNPVLLALDICSHVLPSQPVSVIFEASPETEKTMSAVPFTFEFYKIPVVGIQSRSSVMSNSYIHPQYARTLPAYSHQAGVWYNTLSHLKYNMVIFVYSDDIEGEAALSTFRQHMLDSPTIYGKQSLEIRRLVVLNAYTTDYTPSLEPLLLVDARVVLLAVSTVEAQRVFTAAEKLNILGPSWVWMISEQASYAPNVPQGALSWRVEKDIMSIEKQIKDATTVIGNALSKYLSKDEASLGSVPASCSIQDLIHPDEWSAFSQRDKWWQTGIELHQLMLNSATDGLTGVIQFRENGDRQAVNYDLINIQTDGALDVSNPTTSRPAVLEVKVGQLTVMVHINETNSTEITLTENITVNTGSIIWPGEQVAKPNGVNEANHLRVVTIAEKPFVYARLLNPGEKCNATQLSSETAKMVCPRTFPNGTTMIFCCDGYIIDMLDMMGINMSLTFSLHLVSDGQYGSQNSISNSTGKTEWNGMMGELINDKADMIVAPFTINPERAKYVDFTKPFQFLGITILVKKTLKKSSLNSFLQPFEDPLWILVLISVHVIALILYLLDRFSPFGQLQLAREAESEDALTVATAIWFSWGVLLNSGLAEGTPKSFSGRVLGMIWAGFSMIIVASYTANLAAFLVLDRPEASISGIDDPRLRNPTTDFKFGTVKNSAIEEYFKRQVEYTTMYRTMEKENRDSVEDAIQAVGDNDLNAFIWDSPRLYFEATRDCDLVAAGELFGRSSYGIAFPKNSHWTEKFSLTILSYHEVGKMEMYDNRWIMQKIDNNSCSENESSPATLGLTNMAGVFMMVAIGIGAGFVILLIEVAYSRYEKMKEQQNTIAKKAVARWQRYVKRRKALRNTWSLIKSTDDSLEPENEEDRRRLREYLQSSNPTAHNGTGLGHNDRDIDLENGIGSCGNGIIIPGPSSNDMNSTRKRSTSLYSINSGLNELDCHSHL